jgi:hypothetical protein
MAYVLATDVEDMDPETGAVRVLGKRGESLPKELKDFEDQYIEDGVLVDESALPDGATSMTLTELQHSLATADLSDEQMEAVKEAFEQRRVTFPDGATDEQRRQVAMDVSTNLAQVHKDRTAASPAIHRTAPTAPKATDTSKAAEKKS